MKVYLLMAFVLLARPDGFGWCQDIADDDEWMVKTEPEPRECMKVGLMCKTCTKLVTCTKDDTGKLIESNPMDCNPTFPCDETKGGCVLDGICRNGPFICPRTTSTDPIEYPDPYDCRKYHKCTGRKDEPQTCGENTAWDPAKEDCGKVGKLCDNYPVPLCHEFNEMGTLQGTPYSYRCNEGFNEGIDLLYPLLQYNSTLA